MRPPGLVTMLSVGVLLATSLVGCSPSGSPSDTATPNGEGYPITFDSCGTSVTIEKKPEKILTIGPASAIIVANVADSSQHAFRTGELGAENPRADESGAKVYVEEEPTSEQIISSGTDLVIGDVYGNADPEKLKAAGIPVIIPSSMCFHAQEHAPDQVKTVPTDDPFNLIAQDIRNIGAVVGNAEAGTMAEDFESRLADAQEDTLGQGKSAVWLFYFSPEYPVMSVGEGGIPGRMMRDLGLKNIYSDHEEQYLEEVSWESVLAANPDVIVIMYGRTGSTFEEDKARLLAEPGADTLTAVKNDAIIGVASIDTWPTPAVLDGFADLKTGLQSIK